MLRLHLDERSRGVPAKVAAACLGFLEIPSIAGRIEIPSIKGSWALCVLSKCDGCIVPRGQRRVVVAVLAVVVVDVGLRIPSARSKGGCDLTEGEEVILGGALQSEFCQLFRVKRSHGGVSWFVVGNGVVVQRRGLLQPAEAVPPPKPFPTKVPPIVSDDNFFFPFFSPSCSVDEKVQGS